MSRRNQCPACSKWLWPWQNVTKYQYGGIDDQMHDYWVHSDCAFNLRKFQKELEKGREQADE